MFMRMLPVTVWRVMTFHGWGVLARVRFTVMWWRILVIVSVIAMNCELYWCVIAGTNVWNITGNSLIIFFRLFFIQGWKLEPLYQTFCSPFSNKAY